jgi:small-conductance mechanosensitive channel
VHWWNSTDYKDYLQGFQKLNLELKARFDAEGISFAFPSQTVYLRQDSQWQLVQPGGSPGGPGTTSADASRVGA